MATTKSKGRELAGRKRGLALIALGGLFSLAALVRGALLFWRPMPDTWDAPALTLDLVLLVLGLGCGLAGFWLHHRALQRGRGTPATFLTHEEERQVLAAIRTFEARTSGEIRVHLHGHAVGDDLLATAKSTFERLGMTATAERNGVLFFVAVAERKFAVLGDEGIHAKVPDGFWTSITRGIEQRFAEGHFADGLAHGIERAGSALAEHFPHRAEDRNELPDDISRT